MTENSTSGYTAHSEPPSANEVVAKLRLQLKHRSVEELEEEELVRWDRDEHVVKKGAKFDKEEHRGKSLTETAAVQPVTLFFCIERLRV